MCSSDLVVQGNYFGTDFTGTIIVPNTRDGIDINADGANGATGNLIGGTAPNTGNLIRGNTLHGVQLRDETTPGSTSGNAILGNQIYENAQLGIDLNGDDVVTANDALDADTGTNTLLNFPVIDSIVGTAPMMVYGTYVSAADFSYTLDMYSSVDCDSTTYGEGEFWVDSIQVKIGRAHV